MRKFINTKSSKNDEIKLTYGTATIYQVADEYGCKFVIPLYDFKELFMVENRFFC